MPTFAAIDIGSNSCRLKIARVAAHHLKTLHEDREVTRLGASVFECGLISPQAMDATLQALKRFQRAVQSRGVDQIRVVATSAMRDARNGAVFQERVKTETGWDMEIISGLEEARLIHRGVMGSGEGQAELEFEPDAASRVLLIDLGGGSCEITLSERKRIQETVSVPLGSVRLTEEFLPSDPAPAEGLARMKQLIARELSKAQDRIQPGKVSQVIGTSGTAAALSDAFAAAAEEETAKEVKLPEKLKKKVAGKSIGRAIQALMVSQAPVTVATAGLVPAQEVRRLADELVPMSLA